MSILLSVADLMRLLDPMFDSMLTPRERKTLTVRVERIADGQELFDSDIVESGSAWLRWAVFGEDGGSGSLQLAGGTPEMVLSVQSDLQDFLAETTFAWGELREPKDPVQSPPVCLAGSRSSIGRAGIVPAPRGRTWLDHSGR
jgi:hypothetical protein